MLEKELLTKLVGLLIRCISTSEDVRESVPRPVELVISLLQHFEHLAL